MLIIQLLTAVLLGYGMYLLLTDFILSPTPRAKKAILAHKKGARGLAESITIPLAEWLSKKIRLSEARKDALQKSLYSAEMHMSPEFYTANALANGILIIAFAIPLYFIIPVMSIACIGIGVLVFFKELQSVELIIAKKRERIEGELVLFANTIQQCLASSRDVIKIFESYRKICGPELTHELDITLADMKTGNYESALRRFETRINSAGISQLVRGLLAVMRGDEQQAYFQMLTHDLMIEEKERMRRQALKRPAGLRFATVLMLTCFGLVYFYSIGYQIYMTMGEIF